MSSRPPTPSHTHILTKLADPVSRWLGTAVPQIPRKDRPNKKFRRTGERPWGLNLFVLVVPAGSGWIHHSAMPLYFFKDRSFFVFGFRPRFCWFPWGLRSLFLPCQILLHTRSLFSLWSCSLPFFRLKAHLDYPKRASLDGLGIEMLKLVSYSATPEQWKECLRVPLEYAAARGNLDLFNKLLEAGADRSADGGAAATFLSSTLLRNNAKKPYVRGGGSIATENCRGVPQKSTNPTRPPKYVCTTVKREGPFPNILGSKLRINACSLAYRPTRSHEQAARS